MAIKLQIHPSSSSLDMLGPPDSSSAYSLSGHISLSLAPSHSLFERRRAVRILLRSLVITFEGQAELVVEEAGYAAVRLCSISKELVSKTMVELSNEGAEDGEQPCTWHVMFDLPIPGWLPASDRYGDGRQGFSGTQYNLYATVKCTNAEETSSSSSFGPSVWMSALCSPFSSRNKVVHADRCGITLNRFAFPPASSAPQNPAFYSVTPTTGTPRLEDNPHPVPADIMSKVELLASVPEYVSMDDEKIPFALSVRASSLSESQAAKLRVSRMSIELKQVQDYTSYAGAYAARYPVSSLKDQPPSKSLRNPHPVSTLYDIGLLAPPVPFAFSETLSLFPGSERVDIPLASGDHARKCAEGIHPNRWFTIESHVPFSQSLSRNKENDASAWAGATPSLRATSHGPFFGVRHSLRVILALSYGDTDDNGKPDPPTSFLAFTLPINFVRHRCAARTCSPSPMASPERSPLPGDARALPTTMSSSQSYDTAELPAYSQLFYPNGDARHDDSVPLPLYTPSPDPPPPSGDVSEDDHSTCED